ncbi:hypothetical protein [Oceaniradius stylonematis]|uniref:hypothetical protein n=1 Tax=Oceaniradius stylonematis TaxID=2184161 RepID=UPI003B596422
MVAYNFQTRFAPMVEDGRKTQTIRADRKRHARAGEPVQLYTGMRTAACRKLRDPDPECLMCKPIRIKARTISIGDLAATGAKLLWRPDELERFAMADGFDSHADMIAWFDETHGLPFAGWLIGWAPSTQAAPPKAARPSPPLRRSERGGCAAGQASDTQS